MTIVKITMPVTVLLGLVLILVLILCGCGGGGSSSSFQTITPTGCVVGTSPGALGCVSDVTPLTPCPGGYAPGMSCSQATVSCSNTADISVTYGYLPPAGAINGTVFFHSGSGGTTTQDISAFTDAYSAAGLAMVQMAWASTWEDTGLTTKNVGVAACRPATLMNYILEQVAAPGGAKCAQGFSAGSGAVAYALAWYNAGSYLDNAELLSGPVFSNIEEGCEFPQPPLLNVCPPEQFGCNGAEFQDSPSYTPGTALGVGTITGDASCGGNPNGDTETTPQSNLNWLAMSIVNGTSQPNFSYPNTAVAGWVCNNGTTPVGNNSAAQGDLFYLQFTNLQQTGLSFSLNPISGCLSDEDVGDGLTAQDVLGSTAIGNDMVAQCRVRH
jgi:hypothetical protein